MWRLRKAHACLHGHTSHPAQYILEIHPPHWYAYCTYLQEYCNCSLMDIIAADMHCYPGEHKHAEVDLVGGMQDAPHANSQVQRRHGQGSGITCQQATAQAQAYSLSLAQGMSMDQGRVALKV